MRGSERIYRRGLATCLLGFCLALMPAPALAQGRGKAPAKSAAKKGAFREPSAVKGSPLKSVHQIVAQTPKFKKNQAVLNWACDNPFPIARLRKKDEPKANSLLNLIFKYADKRVPAALGCQKMTFDRTGDGKAICEKGTKKKERVAMGSRQLACAYVGREVPAVSRR